MRTVSGNRRLVDGDLLQPPGQRAVLLDVLVLLVRRRSDDAELAGSEDRLDQRRQVHGATGRGAGADGRVDLVDEEDRHRTLGERVDHRLEPLLEIAAEARAGEQGSRVEREHFGALQHLGDVLLQQPRGQTFGERGLADAGVADEDRIVLPSPAEDLERPLQLVRAANQRIERTGSGPLGEVHRVGRQRIARGAAAALAAAGVGVTRTRSRRRCHRRSTAGPC